MGKKVLIVGGVAGGATAAARLRRLDEEAQIIMFEKGDYISYANCGLPYYIGDVIKEKDKLTLQTPKSFFKRFHVDVRIRNEVVKINRGNKTVDVKELPSGRIYEESYDSLILSPGAEPVVPPFEGSRLDAVFTLRSIPDTYKIKDYVIKNKPQRAAVVGAGYIGIEMAENLHSLGLEVSIIELMDHVIQPLDADMAAEVHQHILSKGVNLYLGKGVTAIKEATEGYELVLTDGEGLSADIVILAVGVRPESSLAKDAGLETGTRGCIVTDTHMRTSDLSIYAVGDAVEVTDFVTGRKVFVPLASPANKQGHIAADNISGLDSVYGGTQGTAILKAFDMTVAVTGSSEKTLKEAGIDYEKSFTFSASNASYYPGATFMTIKLLFDKNTNLILGAQITGYQGVDKRCDIIATAIRAKMTIQDLIELELSYAPPFGAAKDPVNMAGYVASNIQNGSVKVFHWHDVAEVDTSKATLLDVRTQEEFSNGTLENAVNIPVDSLRDHLDEIDRSKPVYVFCQIGLRGYVASRILMQKGFKDVYNLSGGYRFYKMVTSKLKPLPWSHGKGDSRRKAESDTKAMELSEKGASAGADKQARKISVNACGLQCPGPILKVGEEIKNIEDGEMIEVSANDPAFAGDIEAWCRRTGNELVETSNKSGAFTAVIRKGGSKKNLIRDDGNAKNIVVFSGDLDKAIAAFIIANGAASMGRDVNMFFTFWGLNILRRIKKIKVKKNIIENMFGFMMPRGSKKLGLSKMNMMGMGSVMIRKVMAHKNISSLEELIDIALRNGVHITACTMSMDVMGIKREELIDGIGIGGVASMLASAEVSDMSMFI